MGRPLGTGEGEWRAAIRRVAHDMAVDPDNGEARKNIDLLARRVWREALKGEPWAAAEVGNRLDGRPAQALEISEKPLELAGPDRVVELGRRITYLLTLAGAAGDHAALTSADMPQAEAANKLIASKD